MVTTPLLILAVIETALAPGAPSTMPGANGAPEVLLIPAKLDLGVQPPRVDATGTVWLINTGPESVELLEAKGNCGCIEKIEIADEVLPPQTALEIPVRVKAPSVSGRLKPIHVALVMRKGDPLKLPIHIDTFGRGSLPTTIAVEPPVLDLGRIAAATPVEDILLLSNTGRWDLDVIKVASGSGAITFPEFFPVLLGPGDTEELLVEVTPPLSDVGRTTIMHLDIFVDGGRPVTVPVRYRADHALVAVVRGYLDALKRQDSVQAAAHLADNARMWIGTRTGPGQNLTSEAPWNDDADLLAEAYVYDDVRLEGRAIGLIAWSNDNGRRAPVGRVTFWLDGDNRIEGVLCEPLTARRSVARPVH